MGFKLFQKSGFTNITKGLGREETGITKPVEAIYKTKFHGEKARDKREEMN